MACELYLNKAVIKNAYWTEQGQVQNFEALDRDRIMV